MNSENKLDCSLHSLGEKNNNRMKNAKASQGGDGTEAFGVRAYSMATVSPRRLPLFVTLSVTATSAHGAAKRDGAKPCSV